jgi:hypothetical protein
MHNQNIQHDVSCTIKISSMMQSFYFYFILYIFIALFILSNYFQVYILAHQVYVLMK